MGAPGELPRNVEIVETVDSRFMVLIGGFQWGGAGSVPDASGAYPDTWSTEDEAARAFLEDEDEKGS